MQGMGGMRSSVRNWQLAIYLTVLMLTGCWQAVGAQMTPYKALERWANNAPLTGSGLVRQQFKRTGAGQTLSTIRNKAALYELTALRLGRRAEAMEDGVPDPRTLYADALRTANSMVTDDGGERSAFNKFLTGRDDGSGNFFDELRYYADGVLGIAGGIAGSTLAIEGGRVNTAATQAAAEIYTAQVAAEKDTQPGVNMNQAKANQAMKSASTASNMGEAAREQLSEALNGIVQDLINVANENAGRQIGAGALQKSYANVVWMIQQMFSRCFIPIALLLVLPGALLTNMKGLVGFQFLHLRDEDTQGPFTGIFRALIAVFLIPATQVFVSYVIDTANTMQVAVAREVDLTLIYQWAEEQIQTFTPDQQGKPVMNLPISPNAPYRGKAAGLPVHLAMMEQMSFTDIQVVETVNEFVALLAQGIAILSAFQLVFMAYLFLLGPIAAALFAWPGVGRDVFKKAFSSWTDGVVILAMWKFWWNIVLLCMSVWLQQGGVNPYDPVNIYYLLAFQSLLLFVPFNPFDFKPGEIVVQVLGKADHQAEHVQKSGRQPARAASPAAPAAEPA